MKLIQYRSHAFSLVLLFSLSPAIAQQSPSSSPPDTAASKPAAKTFSQQELDQLLAPIALYPDALLAQVLMASTYPLEVVSAARWSKANPKVTGKALEDAMAQQSWDPAVKSLTAVPQVLQQMDEKLEWTQRLGDAFLAQKQDVMNTVQALRAKADAAGNLKSGEQFVVKKETQASQTIYVVESPKPEVVYVPTYNPTVVYGAWPYPAPPYSMYPPSYVYPPGLTFAAGMVVGAAIWGNCNWGHGDVDIDVNRYNSFNRSNVSNNNWNHNVEHRGGVAYKDQNVARQYNRGSNAQASQAREQYRGRAESGQSERKGMDRGEQNSRVSDSGLGSSDRGARQNAGGGFSGVGNSASTREASSRGSASRAEMGSRGGGSHSGFSGGGGGRGGGRARR